MSDIDIDDVKRVIRNALVLAPETQIEDDVNLMDEYKADSLDTVEFAMQLEEAFGCRIPDKAIKEMKTPALALEVAKRYMPKGSGT